MPHSLSRYFIFRHYCAYARSESKMVIFTHILYDSPLDDPGKKKMLHPRGTKVVIYHLVGNFMLN